MTINGKVVIGENISADTTGTEWRGGKGTFVAEATWNAGSAALQLKSPNGTWITVKDINGNDCTATADSMFHFDICAGQLRVDITDATAVYVYAIGRPQ